MSEKDAYKLTEQLFKVEKGKIVALLVRQFGIDSLPLAEDSVQDAMIRALKTWPFFGIPEHPGAWLAQTAKNLTLDSIRRDSNFKKKHSDVYNASEKWLSDTSSYEIELGEEEVQDAQLRMIFVCCHPSISIDSQIALSLKILCGLGVAEIASAFLTTPSAIEKKIQRARKKLFANQITIDLPSLDELESRLDGVLQTIYLLFNEGYKASSGNSLLRLDLCDEAIRLATLLSKTQPGNNGETHALLALMLLSHSRKNARCDEVGNLQLMQHQDRRLWDKRLIELGLKHLDQSMQSKVLSRFHLEAGIAAYHSISSGPSSTNWNEILSLFDQLVLLDISPIIALNRSIAISKVYGPKAGLKAIKESNLDNSLESYYLKYVVQAEFEAELGDLSGAIMDLQKALSFISLETERKHLLDRISVFKCDRQCAQF